MTQFPTLVRMRNNSLLNMKPRYLEFWSAAARKASRRFLPWALMQHEEQHKPISSEAVARLWRFIRRSLHHQQRSAKRLNFTFKFKFCLPGSLKISNAVRMQLFLEHDCDEIFFREFHENVRLC